VKAKPGLDQAARLAAGLKPIARFICLASLAAGGAITRWLWQWLHFSTGWIVGTSLLLGIPAILYGWLWWLLWAVSDLPTRIDEAVGTIDQIRTRPSLPESAGSFRRLGRILGNVWTVTDQADNVMLPVSAAILLANPIGLAVLAIAFACALVLWVVAAIWGLWVVL
jgi:hypothetical protein